MLLTRTPKQLTIYRVVYCLLALVCYEDTWQDLERQPAPNKSFPFELLERSKICKTKTKWEATVSGHMVG